MVALLVSLKLTLLRNSLRRSTWRTVGLVLGAVYALGIVAAVLSAMAALRWTSPGITADVTVLAYALLAVGWLLMALLVFGVDETVDPAKFALLPVRARELQPGLLLAGLLGVPGVATVLAALGLVVAWSRSLALTAAAVVAVPLGVLTCLLLARTATAAFASVLASRRFRDLAVVLLALVGAGFGIVGNLASRWAERGVDQLRAVLAGAAQVASWTPFGWAWALPADVARHAWVAAAAHLVLAVALLVGLWLGWGRVLARRLVEPVTGGGAGTARVSRSGWVERLYRLDPAGAVAARTLRYWRRDPRYLAGAAGLLVAPVVLMVSLTVNTEGSGGLAVFTPSVLALLVGVSVAQDLCYDGSAVWLHIACGTRGAEDRRGRALSALTVFGPLLLVLHAVATGMTGRWSELGAALGLTGAWLLGGLGVGSLVGALWQWPAPPPGANPFSRGNAGGLPALLSFAVTSLGTFMAGLPTLALVVWAVWEPAAGWLALPVGLVTGLVVLEVGVRQGGRLLERRWPEVLRAVSERAA